jgi:hypothetical protein
VEIGARNNMFELKKDLSSACAHYPKLQIVELDGKLSLSGEVELLHPVEGEPIDTFSVDISFPDMFPFCFPKVLETSGKIERTQDRHVFPQTDNLCFAVEVEEHMKCRRGITTRWFLDTVLVPRLAEEYIVNNGGSYAHEFSHGPLGDFEFYFLKFKTKNPAHVIRFLKLILDGALPKHFERCSCGSGLKFKKCHRFIFEDLKALGDLFLMHELNKLEKFLQSVKAQHTRITG